MKPGLLGTVEYIVGGKREKSKLTTPGPVQLYKLLAQMRDSGDKCVIMEVSSHALDQERVGGMEFEGAVFTNLTRDHLDYHGTMDAYAACKAKLFERLLPHGVAAVNFTDPWGEFMARKARGRVVPFGIGLKGPVQLEDVILGADATELVMLYGGRRLRIHSRLVGRFNAFNILGVSTLAFGLGIGPEALKEGIEGMPSVPGRLERPASVRPRVYVDYAHTDDALVTALKALRELPHQRLIVVFGCGGDRDKGKRPLMGRAAQQYSDKAIVTSDNPRSEDPMDIIRDVLTGMSLDGCVVEPDREKAITLAIREAGEEDIVLIAGKVHEDYQIFASGTIRFDDREVARVALKGRS
jgi:UDP-N-acetylmuramyl-tripeptide synthetase